jgi:hypothetical protein
VSTKKNLARVRKTGYPSNKISDIPKYYPSNYMGAVIQI